MNINSVSTGPLLSIVMETFNAEPGSEIELAAVFHKLTQQDYPQERMEIIVVIHQENEALIQFMVSEFPKYKVVIIEDPSYYNMKYFGLKAAKGDIIALLDSDCLPTKKWASSIIETMGNGTDFIAGKTRYDSGWFTRLFNLFSFGHIRNNEAGEANSFIPNNAAFKREVVDQLKFDTRRRRCFGAHLIANELKALNYKLVYNPHQFVNHYNYGLRYHLANRFRSGFEAVLLRQNDSTNVLPEKKYLKLGVLVPFIFGFRRLVHDFKILSSNRNDLNITLLEVPIFFLGALLIRGLEIIPGIITIINPHFLKKKYGW